MMRVIREKQARWMNYVKHETLDNNPSQNYNHEATEQTMTTTI